MKKLMLLAVMMITTMATRAQMSEGTISVMPKVGANYSDVSGAGKVIDNKWGLAAGAEVEYKFKDWFGLSGGLMYEQQGFKHKETGNKLKTEYINIPILAKFYVWKGLCLSTGLQPGFLTKAKYGKSGLVPEEYTDVKSDVNKFDLSLPVAISYDFPFGLNIELRYYDGIIDVIKNDAASKFGTTSMTNRWYEEKNKNRTLQLSIGYKFAVGKKM